ncbi:unnamed protein product [Lepeophtheirus salmonis]|uniref:(salmon louse) hypothetical protein n=1 Tax=Lepeophtheirus salmonis TaxID=72036 RepID=A0A7R8GZT5_LEPSM|nr:unnamed protein product [Lepeophtheirus salmonis]CAF2770814.1 unnamed protein product [Lepeophtheirus salmonis]
MASVFPGKRTQVVTQTQDIWTQEIFLFHNNKRLKNCEWDSKISFEAEALSRVGKQDEKSLSCWSSSPKNHLSTSSPASPSSIILASSAPTVRGSLRFKPSRLSSVHSIKEVSTSSSTTTQAKENLSSSWRSTDEGKDFSSVIIRRFDTISLSGKRKKKIREMGEDVQEEFVVENGGK